MVVYTWDYLSQDELDEFNERAGAFEMATLPAVTKEMIDGLPECSRERFFEMSGKYMSDYPDDMSHDDQVRESDGRAWFQLFGIENISEIERHTGMVDDD